ncbi:MAG: hypothetical protein WAL32_03955 [Terriglobales bacterium]
MNYEFYFLKDTAPDQPEVLRVMAPTFESAAAIVARRYGWSAAKSRRRVREYIESVAIRPIEIQNIFERSLPPTSLPSN